METWCSVYWTYLMRNLKTHEKDTRTKRIFIQDGTILTKPYEKSKYMMVKNGCEIGPIKLKVQIGNLFDYTADVIVMGVCANADSKEHVQEKDRVVIQESTGVKAKYVIHVLLQDTLAGWRRILVDCLEEADKKSINSVALPVLGSGVEPQTFSADGVGHCLFAALDDFTSQNPTSNVNDVRLVVPDSYAGCIPAIIAALQDRITAVNSQHGIRKIFKSQFGFVAESRIFKKSFLTVYSDSTSNLDRCFLVLCDRIDLGFARKVVDIDKDVINSLKDKGIINLIDSDILVDLKFNKHAGQITIFGPLLHVLAAVTCLHNKMRQCKMEENNRQFAEDLYDQIRWHWMYENQMASETWNPYDIMTNFYIETAYKAGTHTLELQSKNGKMYIINFQKLVEYPKVNMNDAVMIIRRDIINQDILTAFKFDVGKSFKKSWTVMNKIDNVIRVALDDGEKYQKVEKRFLGEMRNDYRRSVQVVKIERIQNKILYKQYKTKKKVMKQQNYECKVRQLWHEAAEENLPWIINNGFNRSYCGVHEIEYGEGVYFAADTFYSPQRYLAKNKTEAKRYMFLAKVLTGKLIRGNPYMRVLPPVDPAQPAITYDSAVDDVINPRHFVIFNDKQAYPAYLITYTSQ